MTRKLFFALVAALVTLGYAATQAQDKPKREYTKADFINVGGGSLNDKLDRAVKQFKAARQGETVWLAYHFPARAGTSYGPFTGMIYYDDGIKLERKDDPASAAIFLLADVSTSSTKFGKIRTLDLREPYVFEDRQVYWLGEVDANQSLAQLESILRADKENKDLARSGLRAIATHDSSRAIALLKEYATNDARVDVQRSAIANLGRVKTAESLATLIELYDKTASNELKEEIIGGLGRSDDRQASDKLLSIARNDPDPKMRQRAVRRLSSVRGNVVWTN